MPLSEVLGVLFSPVVAFSSVVEFSPPVVAFSSVVALSPVVFSPEELGSVVFSKLDVVLLSVVSPVVLFSVELSPVALIEAVLSPVVSLLVVVETSFVVVLKSVAGVLDARLASTLASILALALTLAFASVLVPVLALLS